LKSSELPPRAWGSAAYFEARVMPAILEIQTLGGRK
jgi:hypothetical protein